MDSSVVCTLPSSGSITPALLYSTSSRPNVSTALATIASASASLETSACTWMASPPASEMERAVASAASSFTSVRTTRAPSAANSFDATIPMPLAPPVMSATFPSRRILPSSRARHPAARKPTPRALACAA